MRSVPLLRIVLSVIAVASIAVVGTQLVVAARSLGDPSNNAVRLAGLALPLLFAAFLNMIVWGQPAPRRNTRLFTHFANGLLLVASVLVMRAVPVTFSFVVVACAVALSLIAFILEINFRNTSEAVS